MSILDELERLLSEAKQGPWVVEIAVDGTASVISEDDYSVALAYRYATDNNSDGSENAALIAAAVNALPALVRVARAALGAQADIVATMRAWGDDGAPPYPDLAAALAELEALKL